MGRCAVSTQKQKRPFALRALAAFAGTLAILFVLLLAAYALPGERVRQHVYDSARTIQNEGLYPEYLGFKLFQMDNYTDTLMLFEAASADELPPLQAMMTNTAYNVDNFETLADDLAWYIEKDWSTGAQRTDAPALEPFSYARYWHGYLIWLRPLLLLMPYTGVRIVQYIVLFALLAVVLVQLRRRCGLRAAVWFAVSQLAVSVWFVPHQVQYFTCFMIAYAGCAWVLAPPQRCAVLRAAGAGHGDSFLRPAGHAHHHLRSAADLLAAGTPAAPAGRRAAVRLGRGRQPVLGHRLRFMLGRQMGAGRGRHQQ